ncbi:hypothetical protein SCLCIDRAFT_138994, partial [Scleroderma citrinum Foug A]
QAMKKFDLWKVPDVLAVHLKWLSDNRTFRDKTDAFKVDLPIKVGDQHRCHYKDGTSYRVRHWWWPYL